MIEEAFADRSCFVLAEPSQYRGRAGSHRRGRERGEARRPCRPHVAHRLAPPPRGSFDPHFIRASCPRIMSTEIRARIFRVLFLALTPTTRVGRSELPKFLCSLGGSARHRGRLLPLPLPLPLLCPGDPSRLSHGGSGHTAPPPSCPLGFPRGAGSPPHVPSSRSVTAASGRDRQLLVQHTGFPRPRAA